MKIQSKCTKYNVKILPLQLSEGRGRVFLVRGFKGEWRGGLFFRGGALVVRFSGGRFSHASFGKKMNMIARKELINGDKK